MKCPGQDTRYWRPGDIFEWPCPACGSPVEFFKDDSQRRCPKCAYRFANPRLELGCAEWCPHGKTCLAASGASPPGASGDSRAASDQVPERTGPGS